MKYEQWERSGSTSSDQAPGSPFLTTIVESNVLDIRDPKEKLLKMLVKVEARVELLRKDTARIEEEKDTLLAALDAIKHCKWMLDLNEFDREDVQLTLRRILDRCSTVEARVYTIRDPEQEESLNQVNQCIDSLIVCVREDPISAHIRCQSFMNACAQSQVSDSPNRQSISVDSYFESVILGCALDDQKRVEKRLQGLLDYFARLNNQRPNTCVSTADDLDRPLANDFDHGLEEKPNTSISTADDLDRPLANDFDHGLEERPDTSVSTADDLDRPLANVFDHGLEEATSSGIVHNVDNLDLSLDISNKGSSQQQYKCPECEKTYKYKCDLKRHFSKAHPSKLSGYKLLLSRQDKKFKCDQCHRQFSLLGNLKSHKGKTHGISSALKPKNLTFKCKICNNQFTHERNLKFHEKTKHGVSHPSRLSESKCPVCEHCVTDITSHLSTVHSIDLIVEKTELTSFDDFILWKESMEKDTQTKYVQKRGACVLKRGASKTDPQVMHFYTCFRSGYFKTKSKGLRHLKIQGSCKINAICPSSITVKEERNSGKCTITYVKTHVGHGSSSIGHSTLACNRCISLLCKKDTVK